MFYTNVNICVHSCRDPSLGVKKGQIHADTCFLNCRVTDP